MVATADLLESIDLNPTDEAAEIAQNIAAVLATPKGSVPLQRDLGLEMNYLDAPNALAVMQLEMEMTNALDAFEPRAEVSQVSAEQTDNGTMNPKVEVMLNGG